MHRRDHHFSAQARSVVWTGASTVLECSLNTAPAAVTAPAATRGLPLLAA